MRTFGCWGPNSKCPSGTGQDSKDLETSQWSTIGMMHLMLCDWMQSVKVRAADEASWLPGGPKTESTVRSLPGPCRSPKALRDEQETNSGAPADESLQQSGCAFNAQRNGGMQDKPTTFLGRKAHRHCDKT